VTLPINYIVIENRYRKEFGDIDALANNISSVGLLHPITINQYNKLIDGQRRIIAF
jgi:ParB family transcriptional regulator, chromosome partitioning protein